MITSDQLKAWRQAQTGSIQAVAARLALTVPQLLAYESGAEPISRRLALTVMDNPDDVPVLLYGIAPENMPQDDAGRVALAQKIVQAGIDRMVHWVEVFGTDCPAVFCVSYWREGVRKAPSLYFGEKGVAPCPAAKQAAWALINQAEAQHIVARTLSGLDACPAAVRAFVRDLDAAPDVVAPTLAPLAGKKAGDKFDGFDALFHPGPTLPLPEQAVDDLAQELDTLVLRRAVPWANIGRVWEGMLHALALTYPPDRRDIRAWIMSQKYGIATPAEYAEALGPYWRQVVDLPAPDEMPAGARDVLTQGG